MLVSLVLDGDGDDGCLSAIYQVGPYTMTIKQRPNESRAAPLADGSDANASSGNGRSAGAPDSALQETQQNGSSGALSSVANKKQDSAFHTEAMPAPGPSSDAAAEAAPPSGESAGVAFAQLANVGWTVWQSAFVLGEWLLRAPPLPGGWAGARVLELGAGTGILGFALAMAGAHVVLTDLPHVTPLCRENAEANACSVRGSVAVVDYAFGEPTAPLTAAVGGEPWDLIVAADTLYWPEFHADLLASLLELAGGGRGAAGGSSSTGRTGDAGSGAGGDRAAASAGCPVYLGYRLRSGQELDFEAKAAAAGFVIEALPSSELNAEYCGDGRYRVVRLTLQSQSYDVVTMQS